MKHRSDYVARGTHILADFTHISPEHLSNPEFIKATLLKSAEAASATVLSSHFHHFGEALGVTGVLLLAESHLSIHTWPESGFAAIDIFMCGTANAHAALETLHTLFKPAHHTVHIISRQA